MHPKRNGPKLLLTLTLWLPGRRPTTHQTATPRNSAPWLSLCCMVKNHRQTLLSAFRVCSSVPAPSLPLLSSRLLGSHSCLLLPVPHLHFGQIWTLEYLALGLGYGLNSLSGTHAFGYPSSQTLVSSSLLGRCCH